MPDDNVWGWFTEWADYGDYGEASRPKSAGKPTRNREWFKTREQAQEHGRRVKIGKPGMMVSVRPSPGPTGPAQLQAPGLDLPSMPKRLT